MASIVQKGINSFKFFLAYKGLLMVGDELLLDGMQRCKQLGALAMVCLFPNATSACVPGVSSLAVHKDLASATCNPTVNSELLLICSGHHKFKAQDRAYSLASLRVT